MADSIEEFKIIRLVAPAKAVANNKDTKEAKPEGGVSVEAAGLAVARLSKVNLSAALTGTADRNPLETYQRIEATDPSNIATQARHTLYSDPGDQALYGSSTSSLTAIENIEIMSWDNPSDATDSYTQSYTIGFTSTTSTEASVSIGLAPSFEGVSLWNANGTYKRVTTEETQASTTHSVTVTIPPHSNVCFYQRRYYFSTDVYYTLDAWNQLSNAGSKGAYHIQYSTILSHIDATKYMTTSTNLSGTTKADFGSEAPAAWFGEVVRKFENLTEKAKDKLEDIGIDGSQQD